jgi:hypothetical protein
MGDSVTPKIMEAVMPLGLPSSSLQELISGLMTNNATVLANIPGVTPEIIDAGSDGLREAYVLGFRYVWVAAACFSAIATICKYSDYRVPDSANLNMALLVACMTNSIS